MYCILEKIKNQISQIIDYFCYGDSTFAFYFFTAIEEEIDSAIYVAYYTYTAYNLESVPQLLVHPEEEYFDIYLSELRYLQESCGRNHLIFVCICDCDFGKG